MTIDLRISSNEVVGGTCNNFEVIFGSNTSDILSRVTEVQIKAVSFKNSVYNVNTNNNTFKLIHSVDGELTITIPPGQYIMTDLITALKTQIDASASSFVVTITQDPINFKLTFVASFGAFIFEPSTLLGFTVDSEFQGNVTADSLPDLGGLSMLHIHSPQLGETLISSEASQNVSRVNGFLSIPITAPFGFNQAWEGNSTHVLEFERPRNLQKISFTLRDGDGRLIDCDENQDTVIVLSLPVSV